MPVAVPPMIAVTACRQAPNDHPLHKVSEKYITCLPDDALPVLVPALGERIDVAALVRRVDGLLLTGSPSNVEPRHYGGPASVEGTAHDPARDATTLPLIRAAVAEGVPLFAICRGIQELNVALGGTLHQRVHELDDRLDHRSRKDVDFDRKYRPAHPVEIRPGGLLERLLGRSTVLVNSLHAQAIDRPADGLFLEAVAPDGIVEAVSIPGAPAFALGVQWHPEWPPGGNPASEALFAAFAEACRARAAARIGGFARAAE